MTSMCLNAVHFHPASKDDRSRGLLGWVDCEINGLHVDGVGVRRTRTGRLVISFPRGRRRLRPAVSPVRDEDRDAIEKLILRELSQQGCIP